MSDSSEHLELMLEVVQQETAKLEALRDEVKGLLASAKSLRVELQQDTRQLSVDRRGVASTVETEVERVRNGLKTSLDASIQKVMGWVAESKKTALNTVLWAVGGCFCFLFAFFVANLYFDTATFSKIDRWGDAHEVRIQAIETKLKIKK